MRAIDLYSGVGGWSLGLALSGIEVVASYERFDLANETNVKNNGHRTVTANIRTLDLDTLPGNIDLVVGSPPCTQFSYSNRGGGGDIADGLKDIRCFLSIVKKLNPRFWAMENVPRVAAIIEKEMQAGGILAEFADLAPRSMVLNMEDWGLPQRRKRCIVGNFDLHLLQSYAAHLPRRTLGDVVTALSHDPIIDPLFGVSLPASELIDHAKESPLNDEEVRVNRTSKVGHLVYNAMPFPDPLERSSRTVTATCTRVSRESIVIAEPKDPSLFRRLTLRERASLQGFPVTFQFFGTSHGQKATMIGNAVPPLFSYYLANACLGTEASKLVPLEEAVSRFKPSQSTPPITKVDLAGHRYREDRNFRVAIPGFNFKSGVRFELTNRKNSEFPAWGVTFYFGNSKDIRTLHLDGQVGRTALSSLPNGPQKELAKLADQFVDTIRASDIKRMQDVWTRRGPGGTRPFDLLDSMGLWGARMNAVLETLPQQDLVLCLARILRAEYQQQAVDLPGLTKLERLVPAIIAGTIMGSTFNHALGTERPTSEIRKRKVA